MEAPQVQPGELAPHEPVPQVIKDAFKSWKGQDGQHRQLQTEKLTDIVACGIRRNDIPLDTLSAACEAFQAASRFDDKQAIPHLNITESQSISSYSVPNIPGLIVIPSLLPPQIQKTMLFRLFHRDLSDPNHKTNLHLHYDVHYPVSGLSQSADGTAINHGSFFGDRPDRVAFVPKNAAEHKPITIKAALRKKLRWMTLGGQYDWTAKVYPEEAPPPFPSDIASFIHKIFPTMVPQAAIVNVYSPGDTLSMHRDVSEKVDKGLVSISIGCDAIFIIGLADNDCQPVYEVLRLRSGDAVYMTGKSRLAWHGVASILPGTCPDYLEEWPGEHYPEWKGWMKDKRINLNIRQMFEDEITQGND